jgi:DNA modification methylase
VDFFNKIYNEDCLNIMQQMPDDYCDLTVTSPPYNFNAGSGLGTKYNNTFKDNLSQEQYFDWSVKVITECMRVSKLVAWNIQMIAGNKEALLKYIGYFHKEIREVLIWDKQYSEPAMNEKVLNSEYEFIILFDKNGGGRKIEQAQFERGTVANVIRKNKSKNSIKSKNKQDNHFAVFPDLLPAKLIHYFSKKGDIIFEPFLGSGTTCLQAIKYDRKYIGCELVKEYFNIAQQRINNELSQYKLF